MNKTQDEDNPEKRQHWINKTQDKDNPEKRQHWVNKDPGQRKSRDTGNIG